MVYFKEKYKPWIINPLTNEKTIQRWCDTHNVFINVTADDSTLWAGFANMYGQMHGLTVVESGSFSYMVSMFMTGMGVSCGTEMYFRENDIEYHILGILDELRDEVDDEEELAKKLFYEIEELYKWDIEKYSLKTNSLNFRLSLSDYGRFMEVDGETKVDKLRTLLDNYYRE